MGRVATSRRRSTCPGASRSVFYVSLRVQKAPVHAHLRVEAGDGLARGPFGLLYVVLEGYQLFLGRHVLVVPEERDALFTIDLLGEDVDNDAHLCKQRLALRAQALGAEGSYMFGPTYLVQPVAELGARSASVYLPAGARWRYYFNSSLQWAGGQQVQVAAPLEEFPLFVRM